MRWFASCYAKPLWWRLGVGVAAALLGAVLRLAFVGLLENRLVYVTFYPAVEVAALLGGIASGGVTTVICALLAHRWVTPIANLGDWLGLAIFLTTATVISCITEALHRTWIRLSNAKTRAAYQFLVYPKGAFILHMIRMMMFNQGGKGDARFQTMMKDFVETNFNRDVSTEDFKRAVEKHMGSNMDWFFNEWVYGTEMPSYRFEYQLGDGGTTLSGKIAQTFEDQSIGMASRRNQCRQCL